MVKNISDKQKRIVEAKIKGLKNKDIAKIEYPQATQGSGEVLVSRQLKKEAVAQYYQQSRDLALQDLNITWRRIISVYEAGLNASKMDQFTGEITEDHTTRMSAADKLAKILPKEQESAPPQINEELSKALNDPNVSDIQLMRVLKSQNN